MPLPIAVIKDDVSKSPATTQLKVGTGSCGAVGEADGAVEALSLLLDPLRLSGAMLLSVVRAVLRSSEALLRRRAYRNVTRSKQGPYARKKGKPETNSKCNDRVDQLSSCATSMSNNCKAGPDALPSVLAVARPVIARVRSCLLCATSEAITGSSPNKHWLWMERSTEPLTVSHKRSRGKPTRSITTAQIPIRQLTFKTKSLEYLSAASPMGTAMRSAAMPRMDSTSPTNTVDPPLRSCRYVSNNAPFVMAVEVSLKYLESHNGRINGDLRWVPPPRPHSDGEGVCVDEAPRTSSALASMRAAISSLPSRRNSTQPPVQGRLTQPSAPQGGAKNAVVPAA
mmetsp:Transcript_52237/g.150407  ORF Transcript_52237/g.150407 Transcript_52237/m.150407 type:complete len:340 (+) Transcript_52237:546-1565(+)